MGGEAAPGESWHMVVIDPFPPEGHFERDLQLVGRSPGTERAWLFDADAPFAWGGPETRRIALTPRGVASWDDEGPVVVDGCLHFDDPTIKYRGFTAQLYRSGE